MLLLSLVVSVEEEEEEGGGRRRKDSDSDLVPFCCCLYGLSLKVREEIHWSPGAVHLWNWWEDLPFFFLVEVHHAKRGREGLHKIASVSELVLVLVSPPSHPSFPLTRAWDHAEVWNYSRHRHTHTFSSAWKKKKKRNYGKTGFGRRRHKCQQVSEMARWTLEHHLSWCAACTYTACPTDNIGGMQKWKLRRNACTHRTHVLARLDARLACSVGA